MSLLLLFDDDTEDGAAPSVVDFRRVGHGLHRGGSQGTGIVRAGSRGAGIKKAGAAIAAAAVLVAIALGVVIGA